MRRLAAALVVVLALAALPATASADLGGLRVVGPPGAWRAANDFTLEWDEFSTAPVGWRFLNAPWDPALKWRLANTKVELSIPVPAGAAVPPAGEYVVEVWLWSNGVNNPPGPASFVTLRYDGTAPGPPGVAAPLDWLDAHGAVPVSIDPPAYVPPSSILGYAVAVSGNAGESPCAVADHCTAAELDQPGGAGRRQLVVNPPSEGTSYVNVVAVSGTGVSSAVASAPVHVDATPPTIRFAGVSGDWVDHPVTVGAIAEDPLSGTESAGPGGPYTALMIDGGLPSVALGGEVTATVSGEGTHHLSAWARDRLGNAIGPAQAQPATVRIDETPPQLAFAASQRPDDPELIEVSLSDQLSGASRERGSIEVRPAGTSERFEPLPTQVVRDGLRARWSSDDFARGSYEFRATGFDAAGNSARTTSRGDGAAMVLRNPVKEPTTLVDGFGGASLVWQRCHRVEGQRRCRRVVVSRYDSRPATWKLPYGRSLRFGGILRSAAGTPLAGQPVEIVETFAAGAHPSRRLTTVESGAAGRFQTRLAPGPSRQVEARFAGTRTLTRAGGRPVTMAVRAGVRFRASSETARIGGEPVIFTGRLLAAEARIPRTGRPLVLQFRLSGGEWSEFRTVQTDRHGRFRFPYEFSDDDSRGIRFQFRAVSPEQSGWPYRPAASAPVAVIGY